MHLPSHRLRLGLFLRFLFLTLLLPYCFAKNEKNDLCAICHAVAKELNVELAKSANSTEIIELARLDPYLRFSFFLKIYALGSF
jgi:hypothetical protein